ncbi:hypothetical protein [Flammeovirga sp. SJP92]|uniref:hypothetical protein n=1 Tax=Flammeovirga sp. SJP92 TaxID=1775430 RepID=UPI000786BD52|nr:hypothetical protein [Flammeovirga sp. SJP92]KXX69902.1 hypothetical protein AVL50_13555 [Flammeovirga sp. SJP92]
MENDLLKLYDDFTLGVAAYQRIAPNKFKIYYINKVGVLLDNFDLNHLGKYLHDIYPELIAFGLIEQLEEVFLKNEEMTIPFRAYEKPDGKILYRANKLKKIGNDLILNIYNDESETYSYIRDMKNNNQRLNKALDMISHDIRGQVTTSLGLIELLKQEFDDTNDVDASLRIIQRNMENIDFKIHALVHLLFEKTDNITDIKNWESHHNT